MTPTPTSAPPGTPTLFDTPPKSSIVAPPLASGAGNPTAPTAPTALAAIPVDTGQHLGDGIKGRQLVGAGATS